MSSPFDLRQQTAARFCTHIESQLRATREFALPKWRSWALCAGRGDRRRLHCTSVCADGGVELACGGV